MGAIPAGALPNIKDLYYRQGLGVPKIAKKLGVSIDAVYYFMKRHNLTRRTFSEENALRFGRKKPSFKVRTPLTRSLEQLKTIGVMLYWAEGYQAASAQVVDLANSKPEMIALFLKFLRSVCGIKEQKLRAYLYCYSNQDAREVIRFWSKITRIPRARFTKPYVRQDFKKEKIGKMKYGLLHVRYYDKKLLELIRKWIAEYVEMYAQVDP